MNELENIGSVTPPTGKWDDLASAVTMSNGSVGAIDLAMADAAKRLPSDREWMVICVGVRGRDPDVDQTVAKKQAEGYELLPVPKPWDKVVLMYQPKDFYNARKKVVVEAAMERLGESAGLQDTPEVRFERPKLKAGEDVRVTKRGSSR